MTIGRRSAARLSLLAAAVVVELVFSNAPALVALLAIALAGGAVLLVVTRRRSRATAVAFAVAGGASGARPLGVS